MKKELQKKIIKLQEKKHRYADELFIVEGLKGVHEAIASDRVILVVASESRAKEFSKILQAARDKNIDVQFCSEKEAKSFQSTDTFPGILAIVQFKKTNLSNFEPDSPIVCLDRVSDPGNMGTIIRTADWFGIKNILLSEDCVDPYNEKTVRSTMGSIFHVYMAQSSGVLRDIEKLKEKGYSVVALDLAGKPLSGIQKNPKTIYVFGSESHGVRPEILKKSTVYTIPGYGKAESLNVGVAVGIVLYNAFEN